MLHHLIPSTPPGQQGSTNTRVSVMLGTILLVLILVENASLFESAKKSK